MNFRHYTFADKLIMQVQNALTAVGSTPPVTRPNPANSQDSVELTPDERRKAIGLMRVNHSGEVCAQALYQGQKLIARSDKVEAMLEEAAQEEADHLAWTKERIEALGGHTSYLNFYWYVNAYTIGVVAAFLGDRWSMGFVEETERQVSEHLNSHLGMLPEDDVKSRAIVAQMKADEEHHGATAAAMGAQELPGLVRQAMKLHAKVMTTLAFWI